MALSRFACTHNRNEGLVRVPQNKGFQEEIHMIISQRLAQRAISSQSSKYKRHLWLWITGGRIAEVCRN